jgi:hypothetical protein
MAASDDFPRGIDLSQIFSSGIPSISLPAVSGLSWVVTSVAAYLVNEANNPAYLTFLGIGTLVFGIMGIPAADTGDSNDGSNAEWSWQGKLLIPPGNSISFSFNTALISGQQATLEIAGYIL